MLSKGSLVRLLPMTSQEQDTLRDSTGGFEPVSCHFKQVDKTLLRLSSEIQRLSFWARSGHGRAACRGNAKPERDRTIAILMHSRK
jgi:hypothetical protein